MRHDWNSLLGNEACAPVTNRTTHHMTAGIAALLLYVTYVRYLR